MARVRRAVALLLLLAVAAVAAATEDSDDDYYDDPEEEGGEVVEQKDPFFAADTSVLTLTASNIAAHSKPNSLYLTKFFAPWCGYCKTLKPEWEKAAVALSGLMTVAAVDAEEEKGLATKFEVEGFPNIKLLLADADGKLSIAAKYSGQRTAAAISKWAIVQAEKLLLRRVRDIKGGGEEAEKGGGEQELGTDEHGGFYPPGNGLVTALTTANREQVLVPNSMHLVEIYAPWCGHCVDLKPEWLKAARALKGLVSVLAINADQEEEMAEEFEHKGYPTLKMVQVDADGVLRLMQPCLHREGEQIARWAMLQAEELVDTRLNAVLGPDTHATRDDAESQFEGTDVVEVTERSYDSEVQGSDDIWMLELYTPWCTHCKAMKPEWIRFASEMKGKVKVGAINCDDEGSLCNKLGQRGFPTIVWLGRNKDERAGEYEGDRTSVDLSAFIMQKWREHAPTPSVHEIVDQASFEANCLGSQAGGAGAKQLCFISFLPNIMDAGSEARNKDIAVLEGLADKHKDRPFSYLWAQGGSHPGLEAALGVGGAGYPAFVAFAPERKVYAANRMTYSAKKVNTFVNAVRGGLQAVVPLEAELTPLGMVMAWDGSDVEADLEEEEFDLDELDRTEL